MDHHVWRQTRTRPQSASTNSIVTVWQNYNPQFLYSPWLSAQPTKMNYMLKKHNAHLCKLKNTPVYIDSFSLTPSSYHTTLVEVVLSRLNIHTDLRHPCAGFLHLSCIPPASIMAHNIPKPVVFTINPYAVCDCLQVCLSACMSVCLTIRVHDKLLLAFAGPCKQYALRLSIWTTPL